MIQILKVDNHWEVKHPMKNTHICSTLDEALQIAETMKENKRMAITIKKAYAVERFTDKSSYWEVVFPDKTRMQFLGSDAKSQAEDYARDWNEEYITGNTVVGGYEE